MSGGMDASALSSLDAKIPLARAFPYGLQHVLAMFVANLAPIAIIAAAAGLTSEQGALLIQNAMLIAGIGTFIQLFPVWRAGSGLPIVMGISFTFVSVACTIAATSGYGALIGAVIAGGVIEGVLGLFARYWRRVITPIVAAVVVTAIGFSLLSVGAASFGGGSGAEDFGSWENLALGTVSLVACLAFQALAKGTTKQLAVLFGLVVGYVVAIPLGKVDFSVFAGAAPVALPTLMPVTPELDLGAIISVTLIFLVSATETIGDVSALTAVAFKRAPSDKELSGAIVADGFTSTLSGCFGCSPVTSFSQNVGLIAMTKVVNRRAIATGAFVLVLAGFVPVVSLAFSSLPEAVLGGCTIMMFGNIILSGFQMIASAGFSQRNITIAALSLAVGIGFTQMSDIFGVFPALVQSVFATNCVAVVFVVAIVLSLVLPKDAKVEGPLVVEDAAEGAHGGAR
ncbi:uracil-xanthine permease family protein [Adlercreutzia sp. ZJ242]|uniref:uracil-xanthine permease family protein n=1 Tax=Adlercreutzia sp. ZJ242 TaxID=2709409 RepID=UPI001F154922|nr:solute carrier family 23 protein [Adlercreutzia sp. ZJ242]